MSEQYGPPAGFYNLFGRAEMRASRLMVAFIGVAMVLTVVIIYLIKNNIELNRANVQLQQERVMYGYPNADGVFVSEKTVPERHLRAFVTEFIDNYYNFTPESALTNANEAMRLMSPRLRALKEDELRNTAKQSFEQQITQVLVRTSPYEIKVTPQGYVVTFQAMRYRALLNTVFGKTKYNLAFLLKPIKPSKHFDWAIVTDDLKAQEITQ